MHPSFLLTMSLFAFITTLYDLTTFHKRVSLMSILLLMVANYDFHVIFPQCTRLCCVRTLYQPMMSKNKTCAPCLYPSLVWTMLSFSYNSFPIGSYVHYTNSRVRKAGLEPACRSTWFLVMTVYHFQHLRMKHNQKTHGDSNPRHAIQQDTAFYSCPSSRSSRCA